MGSKWHIHYTEVYLEVRKQIDLENFTSQISSMEKWSLGRRSKPIFLENILMQIVESKHIIAVSQGAENSRHW